MSDFTPGQVDHQAIAAIERLVTKCSQPTAVHLPGSDFPLLYVNGQLVRIDEEFGYGVPPRNTGNRAFADVESFATYYKRFATDATLVYSYHDGEPPRIVATFDDHTLAEPGRLEHHAVLRLARTRAWRAWSENRGNWMSPSEMATFLEDRLHTILEPTTAQIVEIVTQFQSVRNVTFEQKVNRQSGMLSFSYTEKEDETKHSFRVPSTIQIAIQPFESSPRPVMLAVALRYRITDSRALQWSYAINEIDRIERDEFEEIVKAVEQSIEAKALRSL